MHNKDLFSIFQLFRLVSDCLFCQCNCSSIEFSFTITSSVLKVKWIQVAEKDYLNRYIATLPFMSWCFFSLATKILIQKCFSQVLSGNIFLIGLKTVSHFVPTIWWQQYRWSTINCWYSEKVWTYHLISVYSQVPAIQILHFVTAPNCRHKTFDRLKHFVFIF